jgi:hypothetical protein
MCATHILGDDRQTSDPVAPDASDEPHPLLDHPLASQLLASVVDWVRQEAAGNDVSEEVARMRSIATRMIAGP